MKRYKKPFKENVKIKTLKFALVEPSELDIGFKGSSNDVTIIFQKPIEIDKEFIKNMEQFWNNWVVPDGYVERLK